MKSPDPAAEGALLRLPRLSRGRLELEVVRPAKTVDATGQPHCADHSFFHTECPVWKQACANFQPYPVRKTVPSTRSFGFTDNVTEEKLRQLNPKLSNLYADDPEFSLSLYVIRFLWRLIRPF